MQVIHFLKLAFVTLTILRRDKKLTILACNPVLVVAVPPQAMALESWPLPGEPGFPLNAFYGKFDEKNLQKHMSVVTVWVIWLVRGQSLFFQASPREAKRQN